MTKVPLGQFTIAALVISAMLAASGCGESGGAVRTPPPPAPAPAPPPPSGPTFTPGVFEPASQFKDRCEVVRTGVDIEGNSFPDLAGSLLEENFWLRSWTNETYLWNTEVVDQDPAGFADRLAYFAVLRTTAQTASGKDKDDFHFSQPTDEFLAARNSTPLAGYGARLIAFSSSIPRDFRILFTEPGSPAAQLVMGEANMIRGTKILEVDGVDLINAGSQAEVDVLNNGLFPATVGEVHTFLVEDPGGLPRTIMMTSANIASKPVNRTNIIDTPTGKVGYMLLNTFSPFSSEKEIADAITAMKAGGVADLVLDLRYNGGGLLAVASQLGYMIAGDAQTAGKIYELLRFNAAAGNTNPVTGGLNEPLPFFDTGLGFSLADGTPLDTLDLPRVFVLSTEGTCSASESVINALRGIDVEVILIGDTTCGKPFGFFPQDNCGETYFTIQFQGDNDKGFGDYTDGFVPMDSSDLFGVKVPGCVIADDFDSELSDPTERLLATALEYRQTGVCPSPPIAQAPSGVSAASVKESGIAPIDLRTSKDIMQNNRDMTMPN